MKSLTLQLNGSKVTHEVEPRQTLADFLREQCRLTATHLGCEHGACGACTVAVDGQATRSCLRLAIMCEGQSVQTLEGLDDDPTMEVLRRHFHQSHALQCGFCTPGMLMMARDIMLRMANPDAETVRDQLSGHICRCTGYSGIVTAIVAAGEELGRAGRAKVSERSTPVTAIAAVSARVQDSSRPEAPLPVLRACASPILCSLAPSAARAQETWNPALHSPLIIEVARSKHPLQASFILEHTAVKPERASREQDQRKPRGERQRQAQHENQVPEIHRVADVTIRPILHDPIRRHAKSRTAAAQSTAKPPDQQILQISPGEQRKARRHDGELCALPDEFECDDQQRAKNECLHRRPVEPAKQPRASHGVAEGQSPK